jgi:thiaminase
MDVIVNDWVLSLLPPKNFNFYLHQAHLILLGFLKIFKYFTSKDLKIKDFLSVVYNSIKLKFFKK